MEREALLVHVMKNIIHTVCVGGTNILQSDLAPLCTQNSRRAPHTFFVHKYMAAKKAKKVAKKAVKKAVKKTVKKAAKKAPKKAVKKTAKKAAKKASKKR